MKQGEEMLELLRGRRSIRKFEARAVPGELLSRLIEAASWAPSASNRQDWFFSVVTSSALKKKMAEAVRARWNETVEKNRNLGFIEEVENYAAGFAGFEQAPAVIVVSALKANDLQKHMLGDSARAVSGSAASAAMAAQNLMLGAHALGLGSCCMTGALAAREELGALVGLDRRREIVCLVAVGYPQENPPAPKRKPVGEISRFLE